jgi:hypothetical protein
MAEKTTEIMMGWGGAGGKKGKRERTRACRLTCTKRVRAVTIGGGGDGAEANEWFLSYFFLFTFLGGEVV